MDALGGRLQMPQAAVCRSNRWLSADALGGRLQKCWVAVCYGCVRQPSADALGRIG